MTIQSISYSVPGQIVTNDDILLKIEEESKPFLAGKEMKRLLHTTSRLLKSSGTEERRLRAKGERALDFIKQAANRALESASLTAGDIDLLLYSGIGRGWLNPGMAAALLYELNLKNAAGFDILESCLGWLRALQVADNFGKNAVYKNIMILNPEFMVHEHSLFAFRNRDELEYRFQQFTIGEAAAATILTAAPGNADWHFEMKSNPVLHHLCRTPLPGSGQYTDNEKYSGMQPLVAYSYSDELLVAMKSDIERYFRVPDNRKVSTDICFCHPSVKPRGLDGSSLADVIGLEDKLFTVYPQFGNVGTAAIPLTMSIAAEQKKLCRGMNVTILVGAAGASYGLADLVY